MDWYEQIDAPVAHIPAALVIDKSTYLSLLLDAFHGIHPGEVSLVGSIAWHWEPRNDADMRLLLTFSASFVKNLKYPFDLQLLDAPRRASRFQQLLMTPLRLAWSFLRPDQSSSIRDAWSREKDAPTPHTVPSASYQLWMDSLRETPRVEASETHQDAVEVEKSFVAPSPAKPNLKNHPVEKVSRPDARSGASSAPSTPSPSSPLQPFSLQYDVSGSDGHEPSDESARNQRAKRKSPDSEVKTKQKTKQRKFEFL